MNHPKLAGIPLILETPKEGPDGKPSPAVDRRNLAAIRRLVDEKVEVSRPAPQRARR